MCGTGWRHLSHWKSLEIIKPKKNYVRNLKGNHQIKWLFRNPHKLAQFLLYWAIFLLLNGLQLFCYKIHQNLIRRIICWFIADLLISLCFKLFPESQPLSNSALIKTGNSSTNSWSSLLLHYFRFQRFNSILFIFYLIFAANFNYFRFIDIFTANVFSVPTRNNNFIFYSQQIFYSANSSKLYFLLIFFNKFN